MGFKDYGLRFGRGGIGSVAKNWRNSAHRTVWVAKGVDQGER